MAQQPPPEAVPLPSPPNDGITALSYLPRNNSDSQNLLASTSWDGALRIHDAKKKVHVVTRTMDSGPLLSMAVGGADGADGSDGGGGGVASVFTGGIDGTIKKLDIASNSVSLIGMHSPKKEGGGPLNPMKVSCSCLNTLGGRRSGGNLVASAGWDSFFHIWDVRVSNGRGGSSSTTTNGKSNAAVVSMELPGKAFSMDASSDGTKIVIATSGRRMCVFDIRMPSLPLQDKENCSELNSPVAKLLMNRESSLKFQTRCVRFFPDATGIAVGSIEGRVAIEYLDDIDISSGGKKKYAFKCHRLNDAIYPVNALAFHPCNSHDLTPSSCIFATGGADGTVVTWDGNNKKKLSSIAKLPNSIACLAWNHDGSQIAMASSYTFEEGEKDHYLREEIYVREVLEGEVRPKKVVK